MRDELLEYYESELVVVAPDGRGICREVSEGGIALSVLSANVCEDPHVERMLEAFCVPDGARASETGRRFSGDHRIAAQRSYTRTTFGPCPP